MFLKQEKPEMDDFERKKYFGSKIQENILLFQNILSILFDVLPLIY